MSDEKQQAQPERQMMKGNVAIAEGAIHAGCRYYFGYPITPQNDIPEYLAAEMPKIGGTFVQAESEIASINMVLGAAAGGARAMTSSSGPGISLMQEGISYLAGSELPAVIVYVSRIGPGLGGIAPTQGDYKQVTSGGGHGDYYSIVLAPASVQEMFSLVQTAFDLSDKYRNPAYVLTDGYIGQMMEPVIFPRDRVKVERRDWALYGDKESKELFLRALKNVAQAQGSMSDLAKRAQMRRESLYRMLSKRGNPELNSLTAVLHAMGFSLNVR